MAQYYEAVGRRKESTARVRLVDGSGTFTVNDKEAPVYFPRIGDLAGYPARVQCCWPGRRKI